MIEKQKILYTRKMDQSLILFAFLIAYWYTIKIKMLEKSQRKRGHKAQNCHDTLLDQKTEREVRWEAIIYIWKFEWY